MNLESFLSKKPLFYAHFDPLRIKKVWDRVKHNFSMPKIIHIIGTNAKGTTGRFIANYLYSQNKKTGHYTSPHISKFNERIWLNGENASDKLLEIAHEKLLKILNKEEADSLSYFEYTTLLCAVVFEKECEYAVIEAGLGGEHDATSIFNDYLLVITPIDYDHKEFLGETIKEIATTKLNAAKSDVIVGFQDHKEVYEIAKEKTLQINKKAFFLEDDYKRDPNKEYLQENKLLALKAVEYLGFNPSINDFKENTLFGRLTRLDKNITIDVGHNALAARAIKKSLKDKKITLIYNTLKDKEYEEILKILKENIIAVEIIEIKDERRVLKKELEETLKRLNIKYSDFNKIDENKEYLVFGSFKTVESFCKRYYEK